MRDRSRSPRTLPRALIIMAIFVLLSTLRAAAVSVSPVALYIDDRTRTGVLTLYNPGTQPEEIRVEFAFGYPVSDEEGDITVPILEEAPAGEPSALPWLRAFPSRLVLEPGQRQVVRVMVQPPAELSEGEYWARVLVRSRGGQPPIEERRGGVAVQIDVETVVVVALSYRNGEVGAGVTVEDAGATVAGDTVTADIDLRRTGNAAFLGRVRAEALDERGSTLGVAEEVLAVYHDMRRRLTIALPTGATAHRVRYTIDTDRDDLPSGGALPAEPIVVEVPVS